MGHANRSAVNPNCAGRITDVYGLLRVESQLPRAPRLRQSESAAVVYPASRVELVLRATMEFAHREPIGESGL